MTQEFTATVWQGGDRFIARCGGVEVTSQGLSEDEARADLGEALELHLEPPHATAFPG